MVRAIRIIVLFAAFLGSETLRASDSDTAFELAMFERSGCVWCARCDRDISPTYPKTSVGQRAPLRRFNLDHGQPRTVSLDTPVRFTPTFVLLAGGKEVGRITGYQNDAAFWGLLEAMVDRHSKAQ